MKTRQATEADIPDIVAMSRQFYATTSYARMTPMCDETVAALATTMARDHVLIVAENDGATVGMIGLFVAPFMFNADTRTAHEVVWWVWPEYAGAGAGRALIQAAIDACRAMGASAIQMVHLASSPPQAAALYEKLGFVHSESSYTLTFKD